eukprot:CAMPEP_0194039074 /NCGR_PEP_ID=MMETSP0009_2-20130614/11263_1 /TAXON_ID=210454 /ORGANISM="Grammatophora oceanica, Strain CCMP 410" /LENGTH=259 /DNA_ID=CAMNT_0038681801 /DNA_START=1 /DNA_END=780 /DNA_ORIENTATION=+
MVTLVTQGGLQAAEVPMSTIQLSKVLSTLLLASAEQRKQSSSSSRHHHCIQIPCPMSEDSFEKMIDFMNRVHEATTAALGKMSDPKTTLLTRSQSCIDFLEQELDTHQALDLMRVAYHLQMDILHEWMILKLNQDYKDLMGDVDAAVVDALQRLQVSLATTTNETPSFGGFGEQQKKMLLGSSDETVAATMDNNSNNDDKTPSSIQKQVLSGASKFNSMKISTSSSSPAEQQQQQRSLKRRKVATKDDKATASAQKEVL